MVKYSEATATDHGQYDGKQTLAGQANDSQKAALKSRVLGPKLAESQAQGLDQVASGASSEPVHGSRS